MIEPMSDNGFKLPTLVASSVVRGARQGDSHGGIYLLDFAEQEIRQVVDWNTGDIDWQGRGWDRGLRGIAFFAGEVYVAASDELFVYDQAFRLQRSFRSTYLKHCHEICVLNNHLYLTSTINDSILAFDLERQQFFWAIHIGAEEDGFRGTAYDPNGIAGPGGADGPAPENHLHLNNVWADDSGLYASGLRAGGVMRIGSDNTVRMLAELPDGTHNARPFRDGVLYNDTASDLVRFDRRDGSAVTFPVPQYPDEDLTHLDLGDEQVARQGFGRGLCVINDRFIAAGSSPSTVSIYDLETGRDVMRVNFSQDIRNAIHGLEVWPF
jgi:hypothetical protein